MFKLCCADGIYMLQMLRIHFYFTMAHYLANNVYIIIHVYTLTADYTVYVAMAGMTKLPVILVDTST